MNTIEFAICTQPELKIWLMHDLESFGAFLRLASSDVNIPVELLRLVQGICLEDNNHTLLYLTCSDTMKFKRNSVRILKDQAIPVTKDGLFRDYSILLSSPYKHVQRYLFAFQYDFPKSLYGILHGQSLCILEYLGLKETMSVRTPSNHFILTYSNNKEEVCILVTRCEKLLSGILRCKTIYWGKTLLDRIHAVLCISENPEDRWRGFHWIPKQVILEKKIIPMMGLFPGKSEFALRTTFTESIQLWSDEYFVSFDKLENERPSFYLQ